MEAAEADLSEEEAAGLAPAGLEEAEAAADPAVAADPGGGGEGSGGGGAALTVILLVFVSLSPAMSSTRTVTLHVPGEEPWPSRRRLKN